MFLGQADSGWRKIDERRVKELHETFLRGDYGLNIQRKPALIKFAHETDHAMCSDGKARLADGKHTFTAMSRILAVFRETKVKFLKDKSGQQHWWTHCKMEWMS